MSCLSTPQTPAELSIRNVPTGAQRQNLERGLPAPHPPPRPQLLPWTGDNVNVSMAVERSYMELGCGWGVQLVSCFRGPLPVLRVPMLRDTPAVGTGKETRDS